MAHDSFSQPRTIITIENVSGCRLLFSDHRERTLHFIGLFVLKSFFMYRQKMIQLIQYQKDKFQSIIIIEYAQYTGCTLKLWAVKLLFVVFGRLRWKMVLGDGRLSYAI